MRDFSDAHVTHLIHTPQVAHVDSKDLLVRVGLAEMLLKILLAPLLTASVATFKKNAQQQQ